MRSQEYANFLQSRWIVISRISEAEVESYVARLQKMKHSASIPRDQLDWRVRTSDLFVIGDGNETLRPGEQMEDMWLVLEGEMHVETGRDVRASEHFHEGWRLQRAPSLFETCCPGIFAAGDVRSGAINRVANVVGEGAMPVSFVHQYLSEV